MPNLLPFISLSLIWGIPVLFSVQIISIVFSYPFWFKILFFIFLPVQYILLFIITAGLISLPAQSKIKSGKFPREPWHKVYFWRRIYGVCWTSLYYFKPIYHFVLSVPWMKFIAFRIFGYKGTLKFTIYPDTWIRDLPILVLGEGAYLSNRATIGTNMCLSDGSILVDKVVVDEKGLVGHLALIGPGAKIGKEAEVGVGAAIGIRTRLLEKSKVGICSFVSHGCTIGKGSQVGNHSYLGLRVSLADGLSIPAGANIPAGTVLATEADIAKVFTSETSMLSHRNEELNSYFADLMSKHGTDI